MKIHEYQGKKIFRKHGITTPPGIPVFSVEEALNAYRTLDTKTVVVRIAHRRLLAAGIDGFTCCCKFRYSIGWRIAK